MLKHFLYDVCGGLPRWTMTSIVEQAVEAIRAQVGGEKVICGHSGGVDSAVAAALVHKGGTTSSRACSSTPGSCGRARPSRWRTPSGGDLVHVKAADRFLEALDGVDDPELKRKAIDNTFIRVFEEVAADFEDARFLVQGTLYPDIIESGTKDAARIKSHHNVGGLPDGMQFELRRSGSWPPAGATRGEAGQWRSVSPPRPPAAARPACPPPVVHRGGLGRHRRAAAAVGDYKHARRLGAQPHLHRLEEMEGRPDPVGRGARHDVAAVRRRLRAQQPTLAGLARMARSQGVASP